MLTIHTIMSILIERNTKMEVNDLYIILHMDDKVVVLKLNNDMLEIVEDKTILLEGWVDNIPKPYSARVDCGLPPKNIKHIHLFKGKKQIISMNADGTRHDGMSGEIPKKAFDCLRKKFPDWNWPSSRIVESIENKTPLFDEEPEQILFKKQIKKFYNSIL